MILRCASRTLLLLLVGLIPRTRLASRLLIFCSKPPL
uniref:Uncharacterized protein n=1 Tax=Anguilla anguilla TaxID=7936 RepID=A0A0E9V5V2_ANGAN